MHHPTTMKDRSDDPSHHGRTLLLQSYASLLIWWYQNSLYKSGSSNQFSVLKRLFNDTPAKMCRIKMQLFYRVGYKTVGNGHTIMGVVGSDNTLPTHAVEDVRACGTGCRIQNSMLLGRSSRCTQLLIQLFTNS